MGKISIRDDNLRQIYSMLHTEMRKIKKAYPELAGKGAMTMAASNLLEIIDAKTAEELIKKAYAYPNSFRGRNGKKADSMPLNPSKLVSASTTMLDSVMVEEVLTNREIVANDLYATLSKLNVNQRAVMTWTSVEAAGLARSLLVTITAKLKWKDVVTPLSSRARSFDASLKLNVLTVKRLG